MRYGYARVSTEDQDPTLQLAALKKAGCKTVFRDEGIFGATALWTDKVLAIIHESRRGITR